MSDKPTPQSPYLEKSVPELVKHSSMVTGLQAEEVKAALYAALTEKLAASIDKHEAAESKLANRILWLNIILGAFTIAGAVLSGIALFG